MRFVLVLLLALVPVVLHAEPVVSNPTATMPDTTTATATRGHLVIIGGGPRPDVVMERIIALAGGDTARIVVVPYASGDPSDVGPYQQQQLRDYGAGTVHVALGPVDADATQALFTNATGVFFSGGDQRKLADSLGGTATLGLIRAVHARGGVIAGTSAGAAVMSEVMLTGDVLADGQQADPDDRRPFPRIAAGYVHTRPGFGFVDFAVIDQHFVWRQRQNRLLSLVLERPHLLGLGIDEATAIHVYPDQTFEVVGESQVVVYDAQAATVDALEDGTFEAEAIRLHLLTHGQRFDPIQRRLLR
ncbi:MAG: cyanophycinase [Bacteroidota bacterium]